jgi:hypothetical protein
MSGQSSVLKVSTLSKACCVRMALVSATLVWSPKRILDMQNKKHLFAPPPPKVVPLPLFVNAMFRFCRVAVIEYLMH